LAGKILSPVAQWPACRSYRFSDCGQVERYNEFMGKFYYTYVLISDIDKKFYTGWTNDLKSRIIKHNRGLVVSTKNRRPLRLVYYEAFFSRVKAIRREKMLKTGFGRKYIKSRI